MASPYGGDRGGGAKKSRKRGGQPGNVNRRGAELLPPAKNTEERRAFLDALAEAEGLTANEQARLMRNYSFARAVTVIDRLGITKFLRVLAVLDQHRIVETKVGKAADAIKREAAKDQALGDIWKAVGACEGCAEQIDQILRGLELQLLGQGGTDGVDE